MNVGELLALAQGALQVGNERLATTCLLQAVEIMEVTP